MVCTVFLSGIILAVVSNTLYIESDNMKLVSSICLTIKKIFNMYTYKL